MSRLGSVAVGHTLSAELATVGARWKVGSGKVRVPLASKLGSQSAWPAPVNGSAATGFGLSRFLPQLLGTTSRYMHARWYLPNHNGGFRTPALFCKAAKRAALVE